MRHHMFHLLHQRHQMNPPDVAQMDPQTLTRFQCPVARCQLAELLRRTPKEPTRQPPKGQDLQMSTRHRGLVVEGPEQLEQMLLLLQMTPLAMAP